MILDAGKTWVYYQESLGDFTKPVRRFPIDEPAKVENGLVLINHPSLAVVFSSRGMARWLLPPFRGQALEWRNCPTCAWRKHRDGCWPAMARDDSYLSWTFDGPHRNLFMTRAKEKELLEDQHFQGTWGERLRGLSTRWTNARALHE